MRDEEEDVDAGDNEAGGHQHGQCHCSVEGPGGAVQRQAARQGAAEAQRWWGRRARVAGLAPPGCGGWAQVEQPTAPVEAHRALAH